MKKFFTLIAVAVMAFAAQANELTVCDMNENAYAYVPVYGYWFDAEGMTQMIYPAEMLTDMAGGKITAVKFYTAATWGDGFEDYTIAFNGAEILLAFKEVDQTAFADEDPMIGGATVVAVTEAVQGGLYLTFELEEPFEYNGGNLLVEAYWDGTGTWGRTYFVGEEFEYNCCYYAYDYYGDWTEYTGQALPMVTFNYEAGSEQPTERTDSPSASKVNYVEHDGDDYWNAYTVTLTPAETEPDCVIWYRIGVMEDGEYVFGEWTEYVAPFNVDQPGSYRIEAYAITEGKLESYPIADEFVVSKLTDVEELFAGKTVANVRYFNVAGQEMQQANGLTIMVTTFTDGTQSTVKVVK